MQELLFVGEERSELAIKMGVTWKDGRLAAKQLFDALKYCGLDPESCEFANWFERDKTRIRKHKGIVIGMGRKVAKALTDEKIEHVFIYHPATRGKIRTKHLYCEHVKQIFIKEDILT